MQVNATPAFGPAAATAPLDGVDPNAAGQQQDSQQQQDSAADNGTTCTRSLRDIFPDAAIVPNISLQLRAPAQTPAAPQAPAPRNAQGAPAQAPTKAQAQAVQQQAQAKRQPFGKALKQTLGEAAQQTYGALKSGSDTLKQAQLKGDALKQRIGNAIDSGEKHLEAKIDSGRAWLSNHLGQPGRDLADSIGVLEGAAISVYDTAKSTVQLADDAGSLLSPAEWAANPQANQARAKATLNTAETAVKISNLANPATWLANPQGNLQTLGTVAQTARNAAKDVVGAYKQDPAKTIGKGIGTVASIVGAPSAGEAAAAGVGKVAQATGKLAEKAAATAKQTGKAIQGAAQKAADAARVAAPTEVVGSAANGIYTSMRPMETQFPQLKGLNPHYVEGAGPGINTNCVACVNAAQERLTGANPTAVASPSTGYVGFNALLPSAPAGFQDATSVAAVTQQMAAAGDGAVGVVWIQQPGAVSHVINVVNQGGKIYFIDAQMGKIVTLNPNLTVRLGRPL